MIRMPPKLRWSLACVALVVAYAVVPVGTDRALDMIVLRWALTVATLIGLTLVIRRQVVRQLREPDAPLRVLLVSVVAGLLLFALVDYAIAVHLPGEFSGMGTRVDALYFALSTLLTVGFGDITAEGQLARMVLCAQMVFNTTVIAGSASLAARRIMQRASAHDRRR